MKKINFLEKARDKHGYKYNYPNLSEKITLDDKIEIEYNGILYNQTVSKHLIGRCPEKTTKKKTTEDFILDAKKIWGDKYDYSLTQYNGALNDVKIIYNGIIYSQRASSHLQGISPEFRNNEESLLRNKVRELDIDGINEIKSFLIKYRIDFEENKNINNNVYQFYIKDNRTIIEYLGKLHYLIKDIDLLKEKYCEDNYIDIIKINYNQFNNIYPILWDNLKKLAK